MNVQATPSPGHFEALQDLRLKCGSKTPGLLDAIISRSRFQLLQRRKPESYMKFQHFVGAQTGDREHLEHTSRNVFSQFLKAWMSTRGVEFPDNVGDRITDTGYLGQSIFSD